MLWKLINHHMPSKCILIFLKLNFKFFPLFFIKKLTKMKISLNFPHKNLNFPPNEWPGKKRDEQQQDAHHEDVEARLGGHMGVCTIKRVQKLINCQFESVMPAIISFLLEIEIVAEKPTISNIADHRVCLPCASQILFYEKIGNYLKFVWRRRHWRRSRFRKENPKFWNSNTAKLGVPLFWGVLGTLEISIMRVYLDRPLPFRPKMLAVDAHLYRLLSPQI